jgi:diaminopimelate epimerase
MQLTFYKYEGTGNDFVMIDNREEFFPKENTALIRHLCDRRFGIGGDGLILLEYDPEADFRMVYYNSDGNQSTMCGNGGRCIVAFAKSLGMIQTKAAFMAIDGRHHAEILEQDIVSLEMADVSEVRIFPEYVFLDTGSPHHVQMEVDLFHLDVKTIGSSIRYSNLYSEVGSNVNFVKQISDTSFAIRTYERGVEDETLSCGTGATAVAIAMHAVGKTTSNAIAINVQGGKLEVSFDKNETIYTKVILKGPATFVFKGTVQC